MEKIHEYTNRYIEVSGITRYSHDEFARLLKSAELPALCVGNIAMHYEPHEYNSYTVDDGASERIPEIDDSILRIDTLTYMMATHPTLDYLRREGIMLVRLDDSSTHEALARCITKHESYFDEEINRRDRLLYGGRDMTGGQGT